ncbi:MAG: DUF6809 family protein [Christensenellaceae bacterium]
MAQQKDRACVLEQLFFGRIHPYEDYQPLPEARAYQEQAGKLEEEFLRGLTDEQQNQYRRLEELLSLAASEDGLLRFMEGYRLGFRLALAGLRDDV